MILHYDAGVTLQLSGRVQVFIDGVWHTIYEIVGPTLTGALLIGTFKTYNFNNITLPIPLTDDTYQFRVCVKSPQGTNQGDLSSASGTITQIVENHQGVTVGTDGTVLWSASEVI